MGLKFNPLTGSFDLDSGIPFSTLDLRYLKISNNLSDLANNATARTNLGLGSLATENTNTSALTNYLALAGGTMTGTLAISNSNINLTGTSFIGGSGSTEGIKIFSDGTLNLALTGQTTTSAMNVSTTSTGSSVIRAATFNQTWTPTTTSGNVFPVTFVLTPTYGGSHTPASGSFLTSYRLFQTVSGSGAINIRGVDIRSALTGGAALTSATDIQIRSLTLTSGTVGTYYGLRVEAQTGATTNYALFTAGGDHVFGDRVYIDNSVSNRSALQIDAHASQSVDLVAYRNSSGTTQLAIASNARDLILDTTTGTKIGTATSQKLAFFNSTPIIQPTNTVAIDTLLVNTGLRASGGYANFATTLQPRAGTATANTSPLKFTAGTLNTVPESGAFEWDGESLYISV